MENPFKNFSQKDWLYVGGAVASIVALIALIATTKRVQFGTATQSDIPNLANDALEGSPNYITYNTGGNPFYVPPIQAGADVAPNVEGSSCCGPNYDCAGTSPLASGDTFNSYQSLLNYYTQTNPNYIKAVQEQTQQYAAYFATGEAYSGGAQLVGVGDTIH